MTTTETQPEIVVLCGSTRFYDEFQQANYHLTMSGKIVLSVGFYPHAKARHGHGEGVGHDSTEKIALDELHKRKIDLADRVLVLNVGGYIGDSTRSEVAYAIEHGKPINWLEPLNAPESAMLTASDVATRPATPEPAYDWGIEVSRPTTDKARLVYHERDRAACERFIANPALWHTPAPGESMRVVKRISAGAWVGADEG